MQDTKPEYLARNDVEAAIWDACESSILAVLSSMCVQRSNGSTTTDSPEQSIDCPVSVQLVGRRLNEEYLLGVTRVVDEANKAHSAKA